MVSPIASAPGIGSLSIFCAPSASPSNARNSMPRASSIMCPMSRSTLSHSFEAPVEAARIPRLGTAAYLNGTQGGQAGGWWRYPIGSCLCPPKHDFVGRGLILVALRRQDA